jgi:hypothetical protein
MSKFIHNVSGETLIIRGIELANSASFLIPDNLLLSWKNDIIVNEKLILSQLQMSKDGITLITDPVIGLSFLKDDIQEVKLDVPLTSSGLQKVSMYEPEGDSATIVTFNLTDKCSWYPSSIQVVQEVLITLDNLTYSSAHPFWIDMTHGRCYDEDNIMEGSTYKYGVKLYIDDVLQTVDESVWTVDYVSGKIIFINVQSGAIKIDYSYATTSYYSVRPKIGKKLSIKAAEVQFSTNILITSPIIFEPWFVGHPIYGTMAIPGKKIVYKNMKDFISACNEGQGLIPKLGELNYDVHVFPFDYARPKPIKYSDYIEIRIYIKNHEPLTGEYATGTFYVAIDSE